MRLLSLAAPAHRRALFCAWLFATGSAWAAPAGQVTNLSGPLFAMDGTGTRRVLSVGSSIETGETLITEGNTYAQVRFLDQGVVTLKPGTHFKVESFAFEEKAPEKDGAVFGLFKGALRKVTGLIGKRGNQDAYQMKTPTATIGIRGTQFLVQFVPEEPTALSFVPYALPPLASLDLAWTGTMTDVPAAFFDSADLPPLLLAQAPPPGLPPGTYAHVLVGSIAMGSAASPSLPPITVPAGLTAFTPPPVIGLPPPPPRIVPTPPGLVPSFAPPPSFQTTQNQAQQAPPGQPPPPPPPGSTPSQNRGGCDF
jgi:hypothetical protein